MNNVIKQEIDWTPQKTEDLILKIKALTQRQMLDIKGSIHSVGNWKICSKFQRYLVNNSKWNSMGETWQEKEFQKFLKDVKCVGINENIIEKKYKGLGVAKKPGQGKRPKNERTN